MRGAGCPPRQNKTGHRPDDQGRRPNSLHDPDEGDGTNNSGRDITIVRDEAVAAGITINALVIHSDPANAWIAAHVNPPGGLTNYFRENVIGGLGGFVLEVEDFASFGQGMTRKLITEIAGKLPTRRFARAD